MLSVAYRKLHVNNPAPIQNECGEMVVKYRYNYRMANSYPIACISIILNLRMQFRVGYSRDMTSKISISSCHYWWGFYARMKKTGRCQLLTNVTPPQNISIFIGLYVIKNIMDSILVDVD